MVRERAQFIVERAQRITKGQVISGKFAAIVTEGLQELNYTIMISEGNEATVTVELDSWLGTKRIWLTRSGGRGTEAEAIGYIAGSMAEVGAHNPYYTPVAQKVAR